MNFHNTIIGPRLDEFLTSDKRSHVFSFTKRVADGSLMFREMNVWFVRNRESQRPRLIIKMILN